MFEAPDIVNFLSALKESFFSFQRLLIKICSIKLSLKLIIVTKQRFEKELKRQFVGFCIVLMRKLKCLL